MNALHPCLKSRAFFQMVQIGGGFLVEKAVKVTYFL